jgi:hypothetical protein
MGINIPSSFLSLGIRSPSLSSNSRIARIHIATQAIIPP